MKLGQAVHFNITYVLQNYDILKVPGSKDDDCTDVYPGQGPQPGTLRAAPAA